MIELHNEDCLGENGLCKIADKSIDMVLCDLPFGITANHWDCVLPLDKLFEQYNRIIKDNGAIVLFGSQPFTTDLINANRKYFRYELIWEKEQGSNFINANRMPLKSHENMLVFYKKLPTYNPQKIQGKPYKFNQNNTALISNIGLKVKRVISTYNADGLRFPKSILKFDRDKGKHPTQKPVALCEWLIKTYTNEGDLVLDNTMGSGTTGVACVNTKRRFIGYELDPKYFEIATQRLHETEGHNEQS